VKKSGVCVRVSPRSKYPCTKITPPPPFSVETNHYNNILTCVSALCLCKITCLANMNNFFAQFRGFDYDRTNSPEHEFERLRVLRQWNEGTKTYKTHRRAFLAALLAHTMSPIHRFFIETYPFPCYSPSAHPKHEFSRLAEVRKWKATNRPYRKAEEEFNKAYQKEFGSRVLDFFEEYEEEFEGFEYNPRGSPEAELDRLAEFNGWGYRSLEWREALDLFHDAIRFDFNKTFGCDDDDIDGWRFLCKVLGVRGAAPETAEACRMVRISFDP